MKALVTGGGGFLGGTIVRKLLARGDTVRSFTRSAYPWLGELGVEQIHGDLGHLADVQAAVAGCDVVFHVAAKAGVWGRYKDYYATNVVGTHNVLAACRQAGVSRLIYTSTPSVVHTGCDLEGATENLPYATHFLAHYPATKAIAEAEVLAANDASLSTVALRPHLIWGPGDPHLIPRVLAKAQAGKLRRIGTRPITVDVTYIDNAADAHVNAADRIADCAGKAYFISNGEPILLWDFLNRILADAGLPPVTRSIPVGVAKAGALAIDKIYRLLRLSAEPPTTRFVVSQLSTSHWYDIAAAKRDLGYIPEVSIEEGLKRLAVSLQGTVLAPPHRSGEGVGG